MENAIERGSEIWWRLMELHQDFTQRAANARLMAEQLQDGAAAENARGKCSAYSFAADRLGRLLPAAEPEGTK